MADTNRLPGLCECGCGQPTALATRTRPERGQIKGQPLRYLPAHNSRYPFQTRGTTPINPGLCACGCGQLTPLAKQTVSRLGWISGQPLRFVHGHASRQIRDQRAAERARIAEAHRLKPRLCSCGCGQPTPLATLTWARRGWIKGQPTRFVKGHNTPHKARCIRGHDRIKNRDARGQCLRCRSIHQSNRHHLSKGSTPPERKLETIAYMDRIRETPCVYCGADGVTIDHQVPLSHGGLTVPENLVSACGSCNSSKGNRTVEEWVAANPPGLPPHRHGLTPTHGRSVSKGKTPQRTVGTSPVVAPGQ